MKKIVPVKHPSLNINSSDDASKQPVISHNPVNVIKEVIDPMMSALNRAIQSLENRIHDDIVLDILIEDIASITGRLIDNCAFANGTATNCKFATKVADEMNLTMSATEKCIEIIDESLVNKNHVFGLTAARELLDAIKSSSFCLYMLVPDSCCVTAEKAESHLGHE